jgi:hypothetical protein
MINLEEFKAILDEKLAPLKSEISEVQELKNKTSKDLGYVKTNSIYINESLTEKNKSLFGGARRAKKELGYSFIWTANGRIFLRKDKDSPAILIKSKDDISNLSRNSR